LPPPAGPAILGGMSGKAALTLFHCVIGPVMVVGGLWLARAVGEREPVAGLALALAALVLPFFTISRVAWATGHAEGQRVRGPNPPAD
jgi:hypothetical protein